MKSPEMGTCEAHESPALSSAGGLWSSASTSASSAVREYRALMPAGRSVVDMKAQLTSARATLATSAADSRRSHSCSCVSMPRTYPAPPSPRFGDEKVANRDVRDFEWEMSSRGRFATPADFPRHDGTPYSHVHVRRERLGFVHRSRTIFYRPVPIPNDTIRNFCIAVPRGHLSRGGPEALDVDSVVAQP
jgi:hypothetical protein